MKNIMYGVNLNWETKLFEWNSNELEANLYQILATFRKNFKIETDGEVFQPEDSEYQFAQRFRRLKE